MNTLRQSDLHVLLLGAGFSAPFRLPVMKDFMGVARRRFFEIEETIDKNQNETKTRGLLPLLKFYGEMFDFRAHCQAASQYFNRNWENIEDLYTQADLLRIADPDPENERRCRSIAWAIWDVYRNMRLRGGETRYPQFVAPFLSTAFNTIREQQKLWPAVITTNYDVLCEIASVNSPENKNEYEKGFWEHYYPGVQLPWSKSSQEDLACDADTMFHLRRQTPRSVHGGSQKPTFAYPLIKLHGSVNWFEDFKSKDPTCRVSTCLGVLQGSTKGINEDEFDVETISQTEHPAIVPPMLGKTSSLQLIGSQWKAAIAAIRAARRITIIGYSFPSTDSFMPRLISEGIKENWDLEEIVIIDLGSDEYWRQTIVGQFTPVARQFKVKFLKIDSSSLWDGMNTDRFFAPVRHGEMAGTAFL